MGDSVPPPESDLLWNSEEKFSLFSIYLVIHPHLYKYRCLVTILYTLGYNSILDYVFYCSNRSCFCHLELFLLASVLFWRNSIILVFELFLVFWHLKMSPGVFSASVLDPAVSLRSASWFLRTCETTISVLAMLGATGMSLVLGPLRGQTLGTCMCLPVCVYAYLHLFLKLPACVYTKHKSTLVLYANPL
jgi:hypothetical protein